MPAQPDRLILASGSPARRDLLTRSGYRFEVKPAHVEEPLEAGHTTTVELTADQPGVFEVESHETELELLQLAVR